MSLLATTKLEHDVDGGFGGDAIECNGETVGQSLPREDGDLLFGGEAGGILDETLELVSGCEWRHAYGLRLSRQALDEDFERFGGFVAGVGSRERADALGDFPNEERIELAAMSMTSRQRAVQCHILSVGCDKLQ